MLSGKTPFHEKDQMALFKAINRCKPQISPLIQLDARDLLQRILVRKPSNRLGCLAGGNEDIKNHKWLKGMDFHQLVEKKV